MSRGDARDVLALAEALRPVVEAGAPGGGLLQLEELPLEDPWEPGVAELNLLLRPFLARAGLDELDVYVELWDGGDKLRGLPDQDKGRPLHQPALWFDTLDEGLCVFGAELEAADDPRRCVADAAHAAARAFFFVHGERWPYEELGETQVDLAAVLLGYGAALLPRPPVIVPDAVLALLADECRRGRLELGDVELALPPRLHSALYEHLTDA